MEFAFLAAACAVLCFAFVAKAVLVTNTPMFWLLLNSAHTRLRLSSQPHITKQEGGGGWEGTHRDSYRS